ncbi:hypothetical protein [Spiroplasma endosymbiont of Polydrusus pterygomalis]|uniref:hypothetical protein n=1 Tax=Spiroplasma endosymbiont of Polydrusus pterygomalis TaxID=3139327 RepID=UPI003CCAB624
MENLKEKSNEKENNKTNMISFQYYGKRFLISGATENQLGNEILKTANYIKAVDFYQVLHHGSDNALGNVLLVKLNQNIAIFLEQLLKVIVTLDLNLELVKHILFQKNQQFKI